MRSRDIKELIIFN